jgi:hypothetical protein
MSRTQPKSKPPRKTSKAAASTALEYVGGLSFPAQPFDLASIPDNDYAADKAAEAMPYIRMCALLLRDSDTALEQKIRNDPDGVRDWVELAEGIVAALQAKRQDCKILDAGFNRLTVVLERIIGKDKIEAEYGRS